MHSFLKHFQVRGLFSWQEFFTKLPKLSCFYLSQLTNHRITPYLSEHCGVLAGVVLWLQLVWLPLLYSPATAPWPRFFLTQSFPPLPSFPFTFFFPHSLPPSHPHSLAPPPSRRCSSSCSWWGFHLIWSGEGCYIMRANMRIKYLLFDKICESNVCSLIKYVNQMYTF